MVMAQKHTHDGQRLVLLPIVLFCVFFLILQGAQQRVRAEGGAPGNPLETDEGFRLPGCSEAGCLDSGEVHVYRLVEMPAEDLRRLVYEAKPVDYPTTDSLEAAGYKGHLFSFDSADEMHEVATQLRRTDLPVTRPMCETSDCDDEYVNVFTGMFAFEHVPTGCEDTNKLSGWLDGPSSAKPSVAGGINWACKTLDEGKCNQQLSDFEIQLDYHANGRPTFRTDCGKNSITKELGQYMKKNRDEAYGCKRVETCRTSFIARCINCCVNVCLLSFIFMFVSLIVSSYEQQNMWGIPIMRIWHAELDSGPQRIGRTLRLTKIRG
jgi:hypothetical protein